MTLSERIKLAKARVKDIEQALSLYVRPGDTFELRALDVPGLDGDTFTSAGFFTDLKLAAERAAWVDVVRGAGAVYIVMNRRNQATHLPFKSDNFHDFAGAKELTEDCDIERRTRLLIDIDPERPSGCCANEAEKKAAMAVADEVIKHLSGQGWPLPLLVDSGNGVQLLYAIDLANTSDARDLVRGVLTALDEQFSGQSGDAKVDLSVFNASRITRLPGTTNKKGNNTSERPHRVARIVSGPDALAIVTEKQLRAVAGEYKRYDDVNVGQVDLDGIAPASDHDVERAWAYIETMPDAISGRRGGDATYSACYRCAEFGLDGSQVAEVMGRFNATKTGGEPWEAKDLDRMIQRAYAYAQAKGTFGSKKNPDITVVPASQGENGHGGPRKGAGRPKGTGHQCKKDAGGNGGKGHGGARPGAGRPRRQPNDRFTDLGNRDRFVKVAAGKVAWVPEWKKWLQWDGKRWNRNPDGGITPYQDQVIGVIKSEVATATTDQERRAIAEWACQSSMEKHFEAIERMGRGPMRTASAKYDKHPTLLNVENGTLDLETGEFRPHDQKDMLTQLAPVVYDPAADCPMWKRFMDDVMEVSCAQIKAMEGKHDLLPLEAAAEAMQATAEKVELLQDLVGYSLTGEIRDHILPIMWGGGENGKSTFFKVLLHLLGDYGMQAPPDFLLASKNEKHPTDKADLYGKRFVVVLETAEDKRMDEVLVKALTGGDNIRARKMFQDFFEFKSTHKAWMGTNHRPIVRGTDRGIWRRLALVGWEVKFNKLKGNCDTNLGEKLKQEVSGILNWALEGHRRWRRRGIVLPPIVQAATDAYRKEMDMIGLFLGECCVQHESARCIAQELYDAFRFWAIRNGHNPPPSSTRFGWILTERELIAKKDNRSRRWVRYGVDLTEDFLAKMAVGGNS